MDSRATAAVHKEEAPNLSVSKNARAASRWSRLLSARDVLPPSLQLTQVLEHLITSVQKVAPEDAAGIFLMDEQTRSVQGQVTDRFDRDLHAGESALQAVLHCPSSFVISRLPAGRRANDSSGGVRAQMVIPFRASAHVRGALVLRSKNHDAYTEEDGEVLSAFASRASTMIENALIHQKVLQEQSGEVERDLVMAHEIMARLIPQRPPQIPGFDVASIQLPAKMVGGDLLDYITLPDDHYGFLVADASGNGIPSALLMTGFRALFRGLIKNDFNIRSVFRKANTQLVDSTAPHEFVTAFYAAVDVTTNRIIYVNGGHVPPLLFRPGSPVRRLEVGGPVLGVLPNASYHEDSGVFHSNDILVIYSDGLTEAESPDGEAFGEDRIMRVVEKNRDLPAQEIVEKLRAGALKLVGGPLRDDLTICVVKFL